MPVLAAQAVADAYPASPGAKGAIIANVWKSRGGFFAVSGATVFVRVQYGDQGLDHWTEDLGPLGAGAFVTLGEDVKGIQFKNGVAGLPATVTAQIAQGDEPPLEISTFGTVSVTGSGVQYQHNGTVVASEPSLDFEDGLLVWSVADDNANTRVKASLAALTGATAAARFVGGTASGSPGSGTFAVGDFVIDQTGALWVCTAAGSPGTWKLISGKPPTRTIFSVSGSNAYTPPSGCRAIIGACIGSGGAGGGTAATGAATVAAGGGGAGGNFSEGLIVAPFTNTPWSAIVGAGGAGAAGAGGGNGNPSHIQDSTLADLIVANGGNGGGLGAASTPPLLGALGGARGAAGAGTATQVKIGGSPGGYGLLLSTTSFISGGGGPAARGGGGTNGQTTSHAGGNGTAGTGEGGGGAAAGISQGTFAGGNGGDGLIVIYEFY